MDLKIHRANGLRFLNGKTINRFLIKLATNYKIRPI